jgi:superfamily II DNA or RNA helicase
MDRSLHRADLSNCNIFIFDEVHHAAAPKTAEALSRVWEARRFGFSASPLGRSDLADLETEAMFGPVIHRSTYQDVQQTGAIVPIHVVRFSMAMARPVTASTTPALERRGIWRNEDRNGLIASAVRWAQAHYGGDDLQILVSVKTVEHAVHLGRHLPDFALAYGDMQPKKRERWEKAKLIRPGDHPITSADRERLRTDFKAGTLKRVIATGIWGTGVDFPTLQVLVRADAQASTIRNTQIPGRVTRALEDKSKEFGLVLDFDDRHNETLHRRAQKRFTAYRKKGWEIHDSELS